MQLSTSTARFVFRHVALLLSVSLAAAFGVETARAQGSDKPYLNWSDNSFTLLPYGWGYVVDPEEQSTVTFEHAHDSRIGDLFVFVDFTKFHGTAQGADDDNWYGEISPRLSLGKTLEKDLSFALFSKSIFEVKDVLVAGQYERGEDADVAEAVLVGVGLDLDLREAGLLGRLGKFKYIQLNFYGRAELTRDARHGIHDVQITLVAARPFAVGSAKFLLDGYFDWVLGLGSEEANFHINPQLTIDLGNFWGTSDKLYAGVEVDFWWNKYQIRNSPAFDTNQAAFSLMVKYHL